MLVSMPIKTTAQAIREATAQLLKESKDYYVIGEGVCDPKGAFGTTLNLHREFPGRVFEMPVSENGMTGVCIGTAVAGMRPIMVHMRVDFLLYAADQIINNAAKWWTMFGGRAGKCPMVIRAVMGRGWGQGAQHSQRLETFFAMIPGLRVVCPSNAHDAKGLLIKASRGNYPVLFLEHRWIHEITSDVPDQTYEVGFEPKIVRRGQENCCLVAWGYMVHECLKAAEFLQQQGIDVNVIDARGPVTNPDDHYILISENSGCPPSPHLSMYHYPDVVWIMSKVGRKLNRSIDFEAARQYVESRPHDVPNPDFRGPF